MKVLFQRKSGNRKTGPIPVSASSRATCPPSCPLKSRGCYGENWPMRLHWDALDAGERGMEWGDFLSQVRALPPRQLWRHNQVGDLPGLGDSIAPGPLAELVSANEGKRGFTYSHKPPSGANLRAIRAANADGFTINLSANNLAHADKLAKTGLPVVAIVPAGTPARFFTPDGRRGMVCPAQLRDEITCKTCGLCAIAGRGVIVGFLPHGSGAKHAEKIANA